MSTPSPLPSGAFSESDDPALTYKPISAMAVVSIVLGVLSLGAFFSMVLWVVPPIAIIVAALTSRRLEDAREEYAGQFIAKMGLFFAVIALAGAPTIYYTKRYILGRESRAIADQFVDLILEHKIKNAFFYSVRPDMQAAANGDVDRLLDRAGKERYDQFLNNYSLSLLGGRGADAQVTHTGFLYAGADMGVERVVHSYRVTLYKGEEVTGVFTLATILSGGVGSEWQGRKWFVEIFQTDPYDPVTKSKPKSG
jgi:hypothetical protein